MNELSVLIIDDDVWMQRILSKIVSSFGFKPYVASNGYDGIALAVEHHPTLIMLDVLMADLSGHQTLKVLKSIKRTRDIPIIMVTAISDIENIGTAIRTGAIGFIGKPFTRATIFEKLRDVLGKDIISQASAIKYPTEKEADEPDVQAVPQPIRQENESPQHDIHKTTTLSPGSISQRYKEDDKRNLDAIKELLLKPKG
ncbi:MAG: response regulator [Ignavibacteria bacterium]|nr:response regulator [Ignavibacteria bacterium]